MKQIGGFVEARARAYATGRDGSSPAQNRPCRFLVSSYVNRASGHASHGCRDALGPISGAELASKMRVDGSPERSLKRLHYPHLQLVLLSLSLNASAATSICNPIVKTQVFLQLFILRLFVFLHVVFVQNAFKNTSNRDLIDVPKLSKTTFASRSLLEAYWKAFREDFRLPFVSRLAPPRTPMTRFWDLPGAI